MTAQRELGASHLVADGARAPDLRRARKIRRLWASPQLELQELAGNHQLRSARLSIIVPTSGACMYRTSDGLRLVADPTSILVTMPGIRQAMRSLLPEEEFRAISLVVSPGLLKSLEGAGDALTGCLSRSMAAVMPVAALLLANRIHRLAEDSEGVASIAAAEALLRSAFRDGLPSRIENGQPWLDTIKLALHEGSGERRSLASIAQELHAWPSDLTGRFRKRQGLTIYQYQLRLRLAKALAELGDRRHITGLAFDYGFSSHSHFSVRFKQLFGLSPTDFRRDIASR